MVDSLLTVFKEEGFSFIGVSLLIVCLILVTSDLMDPFCLLTLEFILLLVF